MILNWDKPEKIMSDSEWKGITADSAPSGVYTPNMSEKDKLSWKAKYIGGLDKRVEIRKSFHFHNGKKYPEGKSYGSQVLIIVRNENKEEPSILISTNGKIPISGEDYKQLQLAISEAFTVLKTK